MTTTADKAPVNQTGNLSRLAVLKVVSWIGTGDSIRSQERDMFRMTGWQRYCS